MAGTSRNRDANPSALVPRSLARASHDRLTTEAGSEPATCMLVRTQIRAGRPSHAAMSARLPAVLGNGVGGVAAAVGHGVDAAQVGRRVITSLRGIGGYAQRAVAPADALIDVPDDVTLPDAVALRPTIGDELMHERLDAPVRRVRDLDDDRLRLGPVVAVGARGDRLERDRRAGLGGERDQRLQPRREPHKETKTPVSRGASRSEGSIIGSIPNARC